MTKRSWFSGKPLITPITTASFAIVAFTGILMLVDVKSAMIKEVHELVSILFVVAAGLHLILNWSCFASYLKKPLSISLGIVVAVVTVLLLTSTQSGSRGGRPPFMEIARRMETATLAQASPLFGVSAEEMLAILKSQDLRVSSESECIADIAKNNGKQASEILNSLLAANGKPDRGGAGSTSEAGSPPPRR